MMSEIVKPGVPFKAGSHIYAQCPKCLKVLKLSGFWKGIHLCDLPSGSEES